jgi:7,8-dihydropterin-6-yl-methyl-4-(beta-D-ribofuranosyl)aminobenzene 5'-phosphate synthase
MTLVDNFVDLQLESTEHVKRSPRLRGDTLAPPLFAEHGFSALVRTTIDGEKHTILLDAGMGETTLLENVDRLGIDLAEIETIVISHGHLDHIKALMPALGRMRAGIPIVIHPHAFRPRTLKIPDGTEAKMSPLVAEELEAAGAAVACREESSTVAGDTILVTGQIPRVTDFEFGLPIQYATVDGVEEPDPLTLDDQALIVKVKDKGLAIISGCAHAGIVNTITYARKLTDLKKVHAVIGGFHLGGPLFESIIEPTVDAIVSYGPDFLLPTHCTGWKAIHELAARLPGAYVQNSVGTSLILGVTAGA